MERGDRCAYSLLTTGTVAAAILKPVKLPCGIRCHLLRTFELSNVLIVNQAE